MTERQDLIGFSLALIAITVIAVVLSFRVRKVQRGITLAVLLSHLVIGCLATALLRSNGATVIPVISTGLLLAFVGVTYKPSMIPKVKQ